MRLVDDDGRAEVGQEPLGIEPHEFEGAGVAEIDQIRPAVPSGEQLAQRGLPDRSTAFDNHDRHGLQAEFDRWSEPALQSCHEVIVRIFTRSTGVFSPVERVKMRSVGHRRAWAIHASSWVPIAASPL